MGRNSGDAHNAFYAARNHGGTEGPHVLMENLGKTMMEKSLEEGSVSSQVKLRRTMGRTDARSGGWAGHQPGHLDPQSRMSGEIDRLRARGDYEGGTPILKKAPSKRFKPKGVG